MKNHIDEMRLFMKVSHEKRLLQEYYIPDVIAVAELDYKQILIDELNLIMSKMKCYTENTGTSEYAMGVEVGLSMAAEMIENLINKINE